MKATQKAAATELLLFRESFGLAEIMSTPQLRARLEKSFKRYYPLLILERGIGHKSPWTSKDKTDQFHLYFREAISDICQSIVLTVCGLYKPAQLSLRSGLENWVRCMGLAEDQSVLALKSTYELIDLVKATPAVKGNDLAKQYFGTLKGRYATLCSYVHTSSAAHMALTTAAGAFPRFIEAEANNTFDAIDEVCTRMTYLFCIQAERTYRGLHHTHFDMVSDALPRKLKAQLNL